MNHCLSSRVCSLVLFGVAMSTASCTSYVYVSRIPNDRFEAARHDRGDGVTESFLVEARLEAKLEAVIETDRLHPFLGLQAQDLDRHAAGRRGVEPYCGLLVVLVEAKSAAAVAGVQVGDVLLSIGDQKTVYADQFQTLESRLSIGAEVVLQVLRGQQQLELQATVGSKRHRQTERSAVPMQTVNSDHPYAGFMLQGVREDWSERMLGEGKNGVLLMSVEVGSPAWLAGFRSGDLVESVDGKPTPTAQRIADLVAERGPQGGAMAMEVRRAVGDHFSATIQLSDYTTTKRIWAPFLYCRQREAHETSWSVGPLGILANGASEHVSDPRGRQPDTRDVFRALLSLVRYESTPRGDHLRLLWFIHIDV